MIRRLRNLLVAIACALFALPASAHELSVARIDIAPAGAMSTATHAVDVELSLRDLALSLPLDADRDERVTWDELQRIRPAYERMVVDGVTLISSAGACALTPRSLAVRRYDDGAYALLRLDADCPSTTGLSLRYALLFDRDPQHRALATLRDGETTTAIAANHRRLLALGGKAGVPFADFLIQGVHHILSGYDHLAFLLSLLLPAALVRSGRAWRPSPDARSGAIEILGVVTAFTAAHSITLSLAALGWVAPAARWVEPLIAFSVALAAFDNLRPWLPRPRWALAFGFGLIHGFGFAGALGELGLPDDNRLLSLLGFNLGVEAGQLAVVCAVLPLLFLLRARPWYARVAMPLLSAGIAAVGLVWLWQRVMPA